MIVDLMQGLYNTRNESSHASWISTTKGYYHIVRTPYKHIRRSKYIYLIFYGIQSSNYLCISRVETITLFVILSIL